MSKTTKLAVGVLALILLGGGVWYYYSEQDAQGIVPKEWKTYRNDEIGYSFEYPVEFVVKELLKEGLAQKKVLFSFGEVTRIEHVMIKSNEEVSWVDLTIYENPKGLTLEEWTGYSRSSSLGDNIKKFVDVNGFRALKHYFSDSSSYDIFLVDGKGRMIEIFVYVGNEHAEPIPDRFLESFQID